MTWLLQRVDALPFPFVCAVVVAAVLGAVWLASAVHFDREHRR